MFDRITQSSKKVIALARQTAARLGHDAIGAGHLFVGVLESDDLACRVLEASGVQVHELLGRAKNSLASETRAVETGKLTFTEAARDALMAAMHEASGQYDYIGTGHLLLGLLATSAEPTRMLAKSGVTAEVFRDAYAALDHGSEGMPEDCATARARPRRVTHLAGETMRLAKQKRDSLRHERVGTEHILLGLITMRSGTACRALEAMGTDVDAVQAAAEARLEAIPGTVKQARARFTTRAGNIVRNTLRAAAKSKRPLSTGDLLIALLREEGTGAAVLAGFGATDETVRAAIAEVGDTER